MPKHTADWLKIASILLVVFIALIGAALGYGGLTADVRQNTTAIKTTDDKVEGLRPAIVDLRIAVAELTVAVKHAHERDN